MSDARGNENANSTGCRVLAGCLLLAVVAVPALGIGAAGVTAYQRKRALARRAVETQKGLEPSRGRNDPPDVARCRSQLTRLRIALQEYQNAEVFFPRNPAPRTELFRNDVAHAVVALTAPRSEGGGRGTPYVELDLGLTSPDVTDPRFGSITRGVPLAERAPSRMSDAFRAAHGPTSGRPLVFIDPWGNPIVYREWAHVSEARRKDARATRTFANPRAGGGDRVVVDVPHDDQQFDLYSWGPNGINEYGTGDDLTSW